MTQLGHILRINIGPFTLFSLNIILLYQQSNLNYKDPILYFLKGLFIYKNNFKIFRNVNFKNNLLLNKKYVA